MKVLGSTVPLPLPLPLYACCCGGWTLVPWLVWLASEASRLLLTLNRQIIECGVLRHAPDSPVMGDVEVLGGKIAISNVATASLGPGTGADPVRVPSSSAATSSSLAISLLALRSTTGILHHAVFATSSPADAEWARAIAERSASLRALRASSTRKSNRLAPTSSSGVRPSTRSAFSYASRTSARPSRAMRIHTSSRAIPSLALMLDQLTRGTSRRRTCTMTAFRPRAPSVCSRLGHSTQMYSCASLSFSLPPALEFPPELVLVLMRARKSRCTVPGRSSNGSLSLLSVGRPLVG